MEISAALLQMITDAVKAKLILDPEEFRMSMKDLTITVNRWYVGYMNARVMKAVDGLTETEVGALQFIPLPKAGHVIVLPAKRGETGAIDLNRSASGKTGSVNLRAALHEFDLDIKPGRNLRLPFGTAPSQDADFPTVGLLRVKRPGRKKSVANTPKAPPVTRPL